MESYQVEEGDVKVGLVSEETAQKAAQARHHFVILKFEGSILFQNSNLTSLANYLSIHMKNLHTDFNQNFTEFRRIFSRLMRNPQNAEFLMDSSKFSEFQAEF